MSTFISLAKTAMLASYGLKSATEMPGGRVLNFLGGLKDGRKAIEMLVTFDR